MKHLKQNFRIYPMDALAILQLTNN